MNDRMAWVHADLNCLLCSRRVGSLVGWAAPDQAARGVRQFFAFKSVSSGARVEPLRGRDQLRCAACGGYGVVDEVERLVPRTQSAEARPRATRWQATQRQRRRRQLHLYARLSA